MNRHTALDPSALEIIPSHQWQKWQALPMISPEGIQRVGIQDVIQPVLWGIMQHLMGKPIEFVILPAKVIEQGLTDLRALGENEKILGELDFRPEDLEQLQDLRQAGESAPVIRLVDNLIHRALFDQSTDIHFEPDENQLRVRYRVDGMLQDGQHLPKWVSPAVASRIKILAELDIAEKRIPQDGRIKWKYGEDELDLRVSTLPTRHGEKVVIRILKQNRTLGELETLGFSEKTLSDFQNMVTRPQGMIFVTGPTGSGKSSTLYAALRGVAHREINITTIEDPIEYELDRANQVQINVKAGLSFATALRSILRQDPDVILVGETRDKETAQIAIQAAQTGHLVLSTLHTNDAAAAVNRLRDLGIAPYLIASSVLGILAQRLVRKLCPHCTQWIPPTPSQLKMIPQLPEMVPHAEGCTACGHSGYKGRIAVFELLSVDEQMRELILNGASEADLRRSGGYPILMEDGLRRLARGETGVEELVRVLLV
jgi:type IV pilus assembly protein PilB